MPIFIEQQHASDEDTWRASISIDSRTDQHGLHESGKFHRQDLPAETVDLSSGDMLAYLLLGGSDENLLKTYGSHHP